MSKYAIYPPTTNSELLRALDWHFQVLDTAQCNIHNADLILCTDITQKHTLPRKTQSKIVNIDTLMARDMAGDLNRAILAALPYEKLTLAHKRKFLNWQNSLSGKTKVTVYGPGPSGILENDAGSVTIITGGAKVADALARDIKIDAIIISDSLALTGHNTGAKVLREHIQKCDCALITTLANAAILAPHWPESLQHLLIGVPENHNSKPGQLLSQNYSSFPTGNVLTALILPVAASLRLPVTLKGFSAALGKAATLAHKNTRRQNWKKLNMWRTHYGSGYLFGDEYLNALQVDVNKHIRAYQSSGISISTPEWSLAPLAPTNNIKAKLYAGAAYADTHPVMSASIAGLISVGFVTIGMQIMTNLHWLILGTAAIGAFAFVLSILHLRTRTKRLADLAERRASEKSQRAFEATNQRLDELEAKIDK